MARWIDGRRLGRRGLPGLACLLAALGALALAGGCGGADGDRTTAATGTAASRVVAVKHAPADRWTFARGRFREMCAGCHTLADAGATGRRYNLDRSVGVEENHVRFTIAKGEPGMPAWGDVLSRREFEELVAYVSTVPRHQRGDDYWRRQMSLRGEFPYWSERDSRLLDAYARRLGER